MKKILSFILSIFVCANVFAIEAKVLSVLGKVQVQKGTAWVDLKPGDVLKKGDLVQTGFKSEAQVSIISANQNSKLTIEQLSRITIEQLVEGSNGDKASVYVATGSAKSEIKKTQDRRADYTVRGPVATASVRGTEFTLKNGFDNTSIDTDEGIVTAYATSSSNRQPVISTPQNDSDFTNLSANGNSAAFKNPIGSFAVTKGQLASFNTNKTVTSSKNAIDKATKIMGMTETALEFDSESEFTSSSRGDATSVNFALRINLSNGN